MKINGKEYKIIIDLTFGTLEDSQKDPENPNTIKKMLKEILVPSPSDAAIRKMKMSDIEKIMEEFKKLQKDKSTYYKKKLS